MIVVMRIKHRFAFGRDETNVRTFLDKYHIKYEDNSVFSVFYLYEDDENFETIFKYLKSNQAVVLATAEYSKEELNSTKWLKMRSIWNHLHPLPDGRQCDNAKFEYLPKTYDATTIECKRCGKGLKQKWNFIVDKDPKWGARNFFHLKWLYDELFISKRAEDALVANGVTGFEFWDVLRKSGKVIDGVKQLKIKNHISEGLNKDTSLGSWICYVCNTEYYHPPKAGANIFCVKSFEGVHDDIVKSKENLSAGGDTPSSLILVTQKFRKVVTEAKLDKGLVFEPLTLV